MLTQEQLEALVEEEIRELRAHREAFGLWINALWPSDLKGGFEDKKRYFLLLLRRLLDEGMVVLFLPNKGEPKWRTQNGEDYVWDVPHEEMIGFIDEHFPRGIERDNDLRLTDYWYDPDWCPGLGWVHPETGQIVAS